MPFSQFVKTIVKSNLAKTSTDFLSQHLQMALFLESKSIALSQYRDTRYKGSKDELERALKSSTTLYVGNLAFVTTEDQVYELFWKAGVIRRVIMGLDKFEITPCGFCFVEYQDREGAENAMRYINGTRLDNRVVRTDWDAGYVPGREYGRGRSGGQVRDEYRSDFDPGRGGYGKAFDNNSRKRPFPE